MAIVAKKVSWNARNPCAHVFVQISHHVSHVMYIFVHYIHMSASTPPSPWGYAAAPPPPPAASSFPTPRWGGMPCLSLAGPRGGEGLAVAGTAGRSMPTPGVTPTPSPTPAVVFLRLPPRTSPMDPQAVWTHRKPVRRFKSFAQHLPPS